MEKNIMGLSSSRQSLRDAVQQYVRANYQDRYARKPAKSDSKWITLNAEDDGGTKVCLDGDGNITKGPQGLTGKHIGEVDRDVKGTSEDRRGENFNPHTKKFASVTKESGDSQGDKLAPAKEVKRFPTAGEVAKRGGSYADWNDAISRAFVNEEIDEDHPDWRYISDNIGKPEGPPLVKDFNAARDIYGQHVQTSLGHFGKVTDIADDAKSVTVTHADGTQSRHRPDGLDHLGAVVEHRVKRSRPVDEHVAYLAPLLAKEAFESGENISEPMKRHGLRPINNVMRAAVSSEMDKLRAEKQKADEGNVSEARQRAIEKRKATDAAAPSDPLAAAFKRDAENSTDVSRSVDEPTSQPSKDPLAEAFRRDAETQSETKPMRAKTTPIQEQYNAAKAHFGDGILLFRMGDFYEVFNEDAENAAKTLGLTLTSSVDGPDSLKMAGFPHHRLEGYLKKLIAAGHRVGIAEQVDPSDAKGRTVERVVTPGSMTDDSLVQGDKLAPSDDLAKRAVTDSDLDKLPTSFNYDAATKLVADTSEQLRRADLGRLMDSMQHPETLKGMVEHVSKLRPDLAERAATEADEVAQERGYDVTFAKPATEQPVSHTRHTPAKGTSAREAIDAKFNELYDKANAAHDEVATARAAVSKAKWGSKVREKAEAKLEKARATLETATAELDGSKKYYHLATAEDAVEQAPDEHHRGHAIDLLNERLRDIGKPALPKEDWYNKAKEAARAEAVRLGAPADVVDQLAMDTAQAINAWDKRPLKEIVASKLGIHHEESPYRKALADLEEMEHLSGKSDYRRQLDTHRRAPDQVARVMEQATKANAAAKKVTDDAELARQQQAMADAFDRNVASMPVRNLTTHAITKLMRSEPRYNMVAGAKKTGWASDGRFMVKLPPKELDKIEDGGEGRYPKYEDIISSTEGRHETSANVIGVRMMEQGRKIDGKRKTFDAPEYLLEGDGSKRAVVLAEYHNAIMSRYPNATPHVDHRRPHEKPVVYRDGNTVVGVVMPIVPKDDGMPSWQVKGDKPQQNAKPRNRYASAVSAYVAENYARLF